MHLCLWLEPVTEIHKAVRSFAETGFHEKFDVPFNQRMDPDLVVPRWRLEIDRERQRLAARPVHGPHEVIDLLHPTGADVGLHVPGDVADSEGRSVGPQ